MATLAGIRTAVSSKLGLDNTAGSSEQLLIDGWATEAVLDILEETQVYIVEASAALTDGSPDYTLDTNILIVKDVYVTSQSTNYILEHASPDEIIQRRAYQQVSGGPVRLYALNGANTLMLWPAPSSGDSLTFFYVPRPTALTTATNDPSSSTYGGIPVEWHKAIEYYVLWQGAEYANDGPSQNGAAFHQMYEMELKRIKKERSYKGGRRLGPVVAGRRKRPLVPHDNSADTGYLW